MITCQLRILTSDLGRGQYATIPLTGKSSYKVANTVGLSNSFTIQAFTWDTTTNQMVKEGAEQSSINYELHELGGFKVSSASGTAYVNISPVKEKAKVGSSALNAAGGKFVTPIKSMLNLAYGAYTNLYLGEGPKYESFFSISARPTKNTKATFNGEMTMEALGKMLLQNKAWDSQSSLLETVQGISNTQQTGKGFSDDIGETWNVVKNAGQYFGLW